MPHLSISRAMYHFYRATLCYAPGVCPSVCQSVTLVYCIQAAEDIVKLFLGPVAP